MAQPSFASRIVQWQREHGRHQLPWQQTSDPYRVWLSEIMLQQTQVSTVIDYYHRFTARFASVQDLADASQDEVLSLWAGLGYYTRARNLHACAQKVTQDWHGQFPPDAATLQTLPGIGPSTAAAIAAFCYGQRVAILDGNVKRVLTRQFAIDQDITKTSTDATLWALAQSLVPSTSLVKRQPDAMARYTQGMMDLGATVCLRRQPKCAQCPVQRTCLAYREGQAEHYPVKRPRSRNKPTHDIDLLWLTCGPYTLLEKRPSTGIWGGLWCLPTDFGMVTAFDLGQPQAMAARAHELTHLRMHITPWRLDCPAPAALPPVGANQQWVAACDLGRYGLPKPIRALLADTAEG